MRFERMSVTYAGPGIVGARLVDVVWEGLLARAQAAARWCPPMDIYQTDGVLHIVVDIAGVDPDDLSLRLFDDALLIEGERAPDRCRGMRGDRVRQLSRPRSHTRDRRTCREPARCRRRHR